MPETFHTFEKADLRAYSTYAYSDLWLSDDTDLEAKAWAGKTGEDWVGRNPNDVAGTNESWLHRYSVRKTDAIREAAAGIPKDAKWLEVGCSHGAHMKCIQHCGWQDVHGCDINAEAVEGLENARVADARHLPYEDQSFDVVTTSGSLMHFGPEERMIDCIKEMQRVSRKWFFFVELYQQGDRGTLMSFGDLLPPAWIMPWEKWLPHAMGPGHRLVRGRKLKPINTATPIALMLIERL